MSPLALLCFSLSLTVPLRSSNRTMLWYRYVPLRPLHFTQKPNDDLNRSLLADPGLKQRGYIRFVHVRL